MTATPKKTGRPTKYSDSLCRSICSRLMKGQSLRTITKSTADSMPTLTTVCRWLATPDHPFRAHYEAAMQMSWEIAESELLEIADGKHRDSHEERMEPGAVQRDRLAAQQRLRVLERIRKGRWSTRTDIDLGLGAGAGVGTRLTLEIVDPEAADAEQAG